MLSWGAHKIEQNYTLWESVCELAIMVAGKYEVQNKNTRDSRTQDPLPPDCLWVIKKESEPDVFLKENRN